MNLLHIGASTLQVRLVDVPDHLRLFVEQITDHTMPVSVTHTMDIHAALAPSLLVDGVRRHTALYVPASDGLVGGARTVEIGALQAAARSLAAMGTDDHLTLLHGSAVTMDGGRSAIAVLDGGRGQGKSSLAIGLALGGGHLLVDEFTFLAVDGTGPAIIGLPRWPWHLRPDMLPVLRPTPWPQPLLMFEDLAALTLTAPRPVPLRLVLIPDTTLRAGEAQPVDSQMTRRRLLRPAVADHLAKLHDPGLDHVSIFRARHDVTVIPGTDAALGGESALKALGRVTVLRIGIGPPHDLPTAVAAAMKTLAGAP